MPEPGKTDHWKSLLDFIGVPTGQGSTPPERAAEQPRLDADVNAPASELPTITVTPPSRPAVAERAKAAPPKPAPPRPKPTRTHWSKLAGALGLEVPPEPEPTPEPVAPPAAVARPPREEARPPREESRAPREEVRPPREESRPPREESRAPREEARPPREEARPAARQTPETRSSRRPAADAPAAPSAFDKRNALDDMFIESPQSLDVFALSEGREEPRRETKRREPEPIDEDDDSDVEMEYGAKDDADLPHDDDVEPPRGGAEPAAEDDRGPRRRRRRRGRGRGRGRDEGRPETPVRKDQPTAAAPLDDLDDLDVDFEADHGLDDLDLDAPPPPRLNDSEEPINRGRDDRDREGRDHEERGGRRRRGRGRGRGTSSERPTSGREPVRGETPRPSGRTEGSRVEGSRAEAVRGEDVRSEGVREGSRGEGTRGGRSESGRAEGTRAEGTRAEGTRGERGRGERRQRTEPRPGPERRSRDEDDLDVVGPASRSSVSQRADDADMEDEGTGEHSIHRRIPTWQEAVGLLVDANMASRAANPERGGGRGRGGRGGGRGGRGGGGGRY